MQSEIVIQLDELTQYLIDIFNHLKSQGVTSVRLTDDYYWFVDPLFRYKIEKPKDDALLVGQLSEDIEWLRSSSNDRESEIGWHLVPLSEILKYIGEKNIG